jgi:adenosylmethionine-8-amino-7-oxononanoate aminotransferase
MSEGKVWHPYTQMKTAPEPIWIERGEGAWLYPKSGERILDLISSWWVTVHGHGHPYIAKKIAEQASKLEQVIFAGFTHTPAQELATQLLTLLPGPMASIFYSDNGSTAVEVGLKMALQYWNNSGTPKSKILAFQSAYHGDTFGAMSVSARSVFTFPFNGQLFEVEFLPDPNPENLSKTLERIQVLGLEGQTAAFIFEPLVMGAAGMICYEASYLDSLIQQCRQFEILTIADEVMTGFGRTGTLFATEQIQFSPDVICLSKGITGGFLPLGVTAATSKIYEAFLDEDRMKTFFHGHSYTANPLACVAALASLECFKQENTLQRIQEIEKLHVGFQRRVEANFFVQQVRVKGSLLAITLQEGKETPDYLSNWGPVIYSWFIQRGFLMRPLGNVLYLLPPYCITDAELELAYTAILAFLEQLGIANPEPPLPGPVFG